MKNLSKSIEDYLETILILSSENKEVKSVKIAEFLSVSKPAVNKAMNELKELGFIEKENYSNITLTKQGEIEAQNIYHKHLIIKKFLLAIGVSQENAEIDCCKIEHVVSDETINCIKNFINKKG